MYIARTLFIGLAIFSFAVFTPAEINLPNVSGKRYLPAEAVRSVLTDPMRENGLAPWLKEALNISASTIRSFEPFAQDEGLASEHYKLTLNNDKSYFIKVEAGTRRIGTQQKADTILKEMNLVHPLEGVEFVTQIASVLVKFDEAKTNEIIVFPLIPGERLDRIMEQGLDKPVNWKRLARALARIKIAGLKFRGTYKTFLEGKGMIGVPVLPDFHEGNVLVGANGKIYILDYQLLRLSTVEYPSWNSDLERILLDASASNTETFLAAFCSEFTPRAQTLLEDYCQEK